MKTKLSLILILLSLNMVFVSLNDQVIAEKETDTSLIPESGGNPRSTPTVYQAPAKPNIGSESEDIKSTTPTISKKSFSPKPSGLISIDVIIQDYKTDYDQQVIITGTLQNSKGFKWNGTEIELKLDSVSQINITTDEFGVYTFTLNFVYGDIGNHDYLVYFNNVENNLARDAGEVKKGDIDIMDKVTPTIYSDKITVGLGQPFTISYELDNDTGGAIDANSVKGLSVDFIVTSSDPSHSSPEIDNNDSVTFSGGVASVTYYAPDALDDYILTISVIINSAVTIDPDFSHVNFANAPASININVAARLTFTYSATIGGSAINSSNFYTRGATNIQILGFIDDPSAQGLNVSYRDYTITVAGGGSSISDKINVTDVLGDFTYTLAFSKAFFPDPNIDIMITITFSDANIQPINDTISIKIAGIFGIFASTSSTPTAVGGVIPNLMYWPNGEKTIDVSGTVLDEDGKAVAGIDVDIHLNTKSAVNNTWPGIFNVLTRTRTTGGTGVFTYTITIPDIGYNIEWLTVNFTLNPTTKWTQPASDVTYEILSFMYFRSITIAVTQDSSGSSVAVNTGITTNDVLNDTFNSYTTGFAKYDISYLDDQGRTPLGVTYTVTISQFDKLGTLISSSVIQTDANSVNNAIFQLLFSNFTLLADYSIYILMDATKYTVTIDIGDGNINLPIQTYTEEFILFGPDDVSPAILNINVGGANSGVKDNITIIVNLDYTKSALDNIRSVTLYYWLSDNQEDLSGDATFTGGYTSTLMNYYPVLFNYNYTIPFDDHGTWVRWYVEVLDKAGFGLHLNGTTNTNIVGYGWDDTFSNVGYFNGKDSITPNLDKMGDTDIAVIDVTTAVRVNGKLLLVSNNVTIGDLILISVDIPADPSNYSEVAIYYRIRTYDPDTGEVISTTAYQKIDLTFDVAFNVLGIDYERYLHLFNSTDLGMDWFTQLDYYFNYTDVAGNYKVTLAISTLFDADPNDVKETWVNDEIAPTGEFEEKLFVDSLVNETNTISNEYELYNSTDSVYVSYNVTDIGSGIKHVNVTIFLYTILGNGTVIYTEYATFVMVLDGNIVYEYTSGLQLNEVVGTYYYVEFDIPTDLFISNNNVTWTVFVVDNANTITTLNDKDGADPVKLIIIDAPVIITPSDDTVDLTLIETTDEFGNIITTLVPVEQGTSNATWIVLGFIAGLAVLIAYYQRHNIGEVLDRRRRKSQAEGTLRDLMDEIYRLGAEGKYKRAILLSWEALERVTREIIQTPRKYFQTAREFTDFLSTITIVERETLLTLSHAFEAARYGKDKPSSDDLDDAVNALKIIVDTIIQSGARVKFDEDDDF